MRGSHHILRHPTVPNAIPVPVHGIKIGCVNDWYIGNGLSCSTEYWGTPMLDIVKTRASYERGDKHIGPERKRSNTDYQLAAEAGAKVNLSWFPYEGIQVKASYDLMAYFNTIASPRPIRKRRRPTSPIPTHACAP